MSSQDKQLNIEHLRNSQIGNRVATKTLLAFGSAVLLGGGASVAIRFTLTELAPFWGAFLRFFGAAIIFWFLILLRKEALPRGRALMGAILFGVFGVGASFALINWGLVETPASISQTISALVPLLTLILASVHGLERISWRGLLGGILAIAGILVVFGSTTAIGVRLSIPHIIAILLGTVFIAEGGVVVKLFPRNPPVVTNAIAMSVGAVLLLAISVVNGEPHVLPSTPNVWLSLMYITIGVSVGAFLLYLYILGRWTASATSYAFVLFPFVTVVLATQLADERISLFFLVGGGLVLLGVWFGALMKEKSSSSNA